MKKDDYPILSLSKRSNQYLLDLYPYPRFVITLVTKNFERGHSFSTYAKFSKKLTFLTTWYAHVCVSGAKKY